MKRLSSNKDLYDYLIDLAERLRTRGADSLAAIVLSASRQAAGLSTEFLGESQIALKEVLDSEVALDENERADLLGVLEQLSTALDGRRKHRR
jgi:hypothetical protein